MKWTPTSFRGKFHKRVWTFQGYCNNLLSVSDCCYFCFPLYFSYNFQSHSALKKEKEIYIKAEKNNKFHRKTLNRKEGEVKWWKNFSRSFRPINRIVFVCRLFFRHAYTWHWKTFPHKIHQQEEFFLKASFWMCLWVGLELELVKLWLCASDVVNVFPRVNINNISRENEGKNLGRKKWKRRRTQKGIFPSVQKRNKCTFSFVLGQLSVGWDRPKWRSLIQHQSVCVFPIDPSDSSRISFSVWLEFFIKRLKSLSSHCLREASLLQ